MVRKKEIICPSTDGVEPTKFYVYLMRSRWSSVVDKNESRLRVDGGGNPLMNNCLLETLVIIRTTLSDSCA